MQDTNVLVLIKGSARYVFSYNDQSRIEMLQRLGRYASNPDLSFSWYDAAVLSQRIQQQDDLDAKCCIARASHGNGGSEGSSPSRGLLS